MSNRVLFLLIAGGFFVFASIFLIIGIIYEKIYQNNMKDFDKEVEGKVLEVTKLNFGSRLTDTYVIYQYIVNNHKYIVKPCILLKNADINLKYTDSENVTCITYMGCHGMNGQTKYRTGEDIIVKYNSNNPKRHEILNDKDKTFAFKVFKITGKILMIIPLIFFIISFFVKGQVGS